MSKKRKPSRQGGFQAQLKALGHQTYEMYLASPHWQEVRRAHAERFPDRTCFCCPASGRHLHHSTYARLGREDLETLFFVCEGCHQAIHVVARRGKPGLARAHLAVRDDPKLRTLRLPTGVPTSPKKRSRRRTPSKHERRAAERERRREARVIKPPSATEIAAQRIAALGPKRPDAPPEPKSTRPGAKQRRKARADFKPFRPAVGGGMPAKVRLPDGTLKERDA